MDNKMDIKTDDCESIDTAKKQSIKERLTRHIPQPKIKHVFFSSIFGFVLGCILTLSIVFAISDIINPAPVVDPTGPTITIVPDDDDYHLTISTVQDVLRPTAALITNQYRYTAADIYDDYKKFFGLNLPFTNSKAVFTFKGTMSIGIDLQELSYEIDNDNKNIHIILPEIGILSHDIDLNSFQFPFEKESIFNPKEMSDYVGALEQLKAKQAELVINDQEYMSDAQYTTQAVLKLFLANSEFTKDYTVTFGTEEVIQ